jgi:hypothetical protein
MVAMLFVLPVVADVVEGFSDADVEARLTRHAEPLSRLHTDPTLGAGQLVLAAAGHALHHFRRFGAEGERGRQNHPDRFSGAVGHGEAVADAFAVEIDAGLRCDGHAVKLGGDGSHLEPFNGSGLSRAPQSVILGCSCQPFGCPLLRQIGPENAVARGNVKAIAVDGEATHSLKTGR